MTDSRALSKFTEIKWKIVHDYSYDAEEDAVYLKSFLTTGHASLASAKILLADVCMGFQ